MRSCRWGTEMPACAPRGHGVPARARRSWRRPSAAAGGAARARVPAGRDRARCARGRVGSQRAAAASSPDRRALGDGRGDADTFIFTSGPTGRPRRASRSSAGQRGAASWTWVRTFPRDRARAGAGSLDQPPYCRSTCPSTRWWARSSPRAAACTPSRARRRRTCARCSPAYALLGAWRCRPCHAVVRRPVPGRHAASPRPCCPTRACSLFCGEALRRSTAAALARAVPARARIVNTYGPTESTVAVTYVEGVGRSMASARPLPVGTARPGTELFIVNCPRRARPAPWGRRARS